jgi:hypothetical protein
VASYAERDHERARRRREARLGTLRRRLAAGSIVAFAGALGLASGHHVGSTKKRALRPVQQRVAAAPARWFDDGDQNYSFDDRAPAAVASGGGSATPAPQPAPQPAPPAPVAQTSVS